MKGSRILSLSLLLPGLLPLQGGGPPQAPASRPSGNPQKEKKGGKGGPPQGRRPLFPGLPAGGRRERRKVPTLLAGTWQIRKAYFPGAPQGIQVRGYAVFTTKYASFHVFLRAHKAEPLFQSGFWRYAYLGGRLRFQTLLGVRAAPGGRLIPEGRGGIHERTPQFLGGGVLRLYRPGGSYLEMIRLE